MSPAHSSHPHRRTPDDPAMDLTSDTYRATRSAWGRIWSQEADLRRELETLDYPRSQEVAGLYLPHVPTDGPVLEAGCGFGVELVRLRRRGIDAIGIDYVGSPLRKLKESDSGHPVAEADVHRIPFKSGAFSAYLSFGVVEHFSFGPAPALLEAHRVLRDGGALVLTVPAPNVIRRLADRTARWRTPSATAPPGYFERTFGPKELIGHVERAGFDVIDVHPVGHGFTLWGLGSPFRSTGYYRASGLAVRLAPLVRRILPWAMAFATLIIAMKGERPGASGTKSPGRRS
jgi:SAM-dependent methyltransferase